MKENKIYEILDGRVVKEARKDDILAIANLVMRCLRLNRKKRPTMRKVQSSLHINHDHEYTTSETIQEITYESMPLCLELDSTSFY